MIRKSVVAGISLSLATATFPALSADSAVAVLKRASATMGAPKTIRYSGEGTGWTFGQAWQPGKAWPKIDIQSQARTLNYASGSMREEIAFSRGEPQGGGGYAPLVGVPQRNDQYLSGSYAWTLGFIVAIPFLIGLFGMFDGLMCSFMVIAASTAMPKPSILAEGISMSIVTPLIGMLLMVPSYLLATVGLAFRAMKNDPKP